MPNTLGKIIQAEYGLSFHRSIPGADLGPPYHQHSEIEITFLEQGSVTYFLGEMEFLVRPQCLTVFDASIPHNIIREQKATYCSWLNIPIDLFSSWALPLAFKDALFSGHVFFEQDDSMFLEDRIRFARWQRDLGEPADPVKRRCALMEIEARLLRLAHTSFYPQQLEDSQDLLLPEALQRMVTFVEQNLQEKLTVKNVAESGNLSLKSARKLFDRYLGMTLQEYVIRERIDYARKLLASTDAKVIDIAMDSGFSSLSHFYEAFQKKCQQKPREYRESVRVF